jgi:hypothetical protein
MGIRWPSKDPTLSGRTNADVQQFLTITAPEQATPAPITVVVNWTAGLKP